MQGLTLKLLHELMEPAPFQCPARCGDDMFHPHFSPSLVAEYVRLGGKRESLGRFCEFPTPEHLRRMDKDIAEIGKAFDRAFEGGRLA